MSSYGSYRGGDQDKSICTFYEKIGACRHGEKCSRKHIKPITSRTITCYNFYQNPELDEKLKASLSQQEIDDRFNKFFEDVFVECALLGCQVEDMVICENANDHLNGNVYVRFATEAMAEKAMQNFNTRWYGQRPIFCELSPVRNFAQAVCKKHFDKACDRGDVCNFMHQKRPREGLFDELALSQAKFLKEKGGFVERKGYWD